VNRVQEVARLGGLGQARRGAEREQLPGLGWGWAGPQDDEARLRALAMQLAQIGRAPQRTEVDDRDVRLVGGER
jgi:hypothetical protein